MTNVEFHLQLNHNETWNMSRLHFHDHCELLLPLVSPGNIFVSGQVYPLRRGTLYLIGENTLHRTMAEGFHARYVLHISRKSLAQLSTPQTDLTQLCASSFRRAELRGGEMTEVIELFQALERNKNDGSFGSDMRQMVALLNLLIRLAPTLSAATAGESIYNKDFLRVAPILDYIRDNLDQPLTLEQICRDNLVGRSQLQKLFHARTGGGVMAWFGALKIQAARRLIREGRLNFTQIAARLGFQSVHYFSRRFRQATGMSPSEYERSVKMLSEGGPAPDESANNVHDSIFPFRPGPPTIGTDSNGTNPQSSSKPKGAH